MGHGCNVMCMAFFERAQVMYIYIIERETKKEAAAKGPIHPSFASQVLA